MKMTRKKWRILLLGAVLALAIFGLSGCSNSPDSVEDPLSNYSGMGVDSLVPFPTTTPAWTVAPTAPPATEAPTAGGYQDLTFGTSGEAVSALQGRLKALGYYGGTIDGKFGESTVSAIKLYQGQMNQQKTGLATALLQQQLFDVNAPKFTSSDTSDYEPYDGPEDDLPDDYEDYSEPVPTKKPTATKKPTIDDNDDDDAPRELQRGDKGQLVRDLQRALKNLGYYTGSVDGDYGSGTATAVKRFQSAYGQPQNGVASLALQRKLYSGDAVPYVTPTPKPTATPQAYSELSWGDTGSAVTRLQRRLRALGYLDSSATAGTFDDKTEAAVKRFQKQYGSKETGIATANLQKKLFAADALSYEPDATLKPTPTPGDDYKRLQPGDTGNAVKALQRRLRELGYFDGEIGGNYLDLTTAAVKRFQKAIGVDQTGIASASLQRRIFDDNAPEYTKNTPKPTVQPETIKQGDKSETVIKIKKRLAELGFFGGSTTSDSFGTGTVAAVKAFQKACDLRQTGEVSRELYNLMMSDEAPSLIVPAEDPADEPTYKKIQPGDTGEKVKVLQRRLRELGYFDGDIGGNYLTKTTNAVKAFQKKIGWDQTGVATVDLQEKLYSKNAPMKGESEGEVETASLKALKYKDTGSRVEDLQNRLIELGFLGDDRAGDEGGTYGKGTRQAVIDAQMARGFDSDGNADLEFMKFIMSTDAEELQPIVY